MFSIDKNPRSYVDVETQEIMTIMIKKCKKVVVSGYRQKWIESKKV